MKTVTQNTPKSSAPFGAEFILLFPLVTIRRAARRAIFACGLATCLAGFALAQTQWSGNGHYYLVVVETKNWQDARLAAQSLILFKGAQSHLATITSADENSFVTTQLGDTSGAWLGGYQPPDSEEAAGGWQWITGEPWAYTQWDSGEPNNFYGGGWGNSDDWTEEVLQYHHDGTHWNDIPDYSGVITPRFLVEWDCVELRVGSISATSKQFHP